jgi:hypothetical protein
VDPRIRGIGNLDSDERRQYKRTFQHSCTHLSQSPTPLFEPGGVGARDAALSLYEGAGRRCTHDKIKNRSPFGNRLLSNSVFLVLPTSGLASTAATWKWKL